MEIYQCPSFSAAYDARDGFQFEDLMVQDIYRLKEVPLNGCAVDIGANIGITSLILAIDRGCKVFSVEPDPRNYALLCDNIHRNSHKCSKHIVAINNAISDVSGPCRFYSREDHSGGSFLGVDLKPESPEIPGQFKYPVEKHSGIFKKVCVQCLTLQELFDTNSIETCDFMKLDCEGSEYLIFQESNLDLFKNRINRVAFECHSDSAEHCVRYLQRAGYDVQNTDYVIGKVIHAIRSV